MPKIVSRSAVSASTDAPQTESATAALRVYYCLCGEFAVRHSTAFDVVVRLSNSVL